MNTGAGGLFGPGSPLIQLAPFALILVVFYFLLIRPQQQKAKETQEMLDNLRVNDDIVTSGGLYGKVVRAGREDRGRRDRAQGAGQDRPSRRRQVLRASKAAEKGGDKSSEEKSA